MSLLSPRVHSLDQTELFYPAESCILFRFVLQRLRFVILLLTLTLASLLVFLVVYARGNNHNDVIAKISFVYNSRTLQYSPHDFDRSVSLGVNERKVVLPHDFSEQDLVRNFQVKADGNDVFVQLRIQKTGSTTFRNHLAYDIDFGRRHKCRNDTKRSPCPLPAVFPPASNAWWCGLHADWTYLQECVPSEVKKIHPSNSNPRLFYLTMVREPVRRYISEWLHVQRGATWKDAVTRCKKQDATLTEIPPCKFGSTLKYVSLTKFSNCSSNLAHNRQTRMLADLASVNCYNSSGMSYKERHLRMLESAKKNLKDMAYFGLTGYQKYSQMLFEHSFGLRFKNEFRHARHVHADKTRVSPSEVKRLEEINMYDVALYQYAKDLFFQRLSRVLNRNVNPNDDIGSRHAELIHHN